MKTKMKNLFLTFLAALALPQMAAAGSTIDMCVLSGSCNWSDGSTWTGGVAPADGDSAYCSKDVTVTGDRVVSLPASGTAKLQEFVVYANGGHLTTFENGKIVLGDYYDRPIWFKGSSTYEGHATFAKVQFDFLDSRTSHKTPYIALDTRSTTIFDEVSLVSTIKPYIQAGSLEGGSNQPVTLTIKNSALDFGSSKKRFVVKDTVSQLNLTIDNSTVANLILGVNGTTGTTASSPIALTVKLGDKNTSTAAPFSGDVYFASGSTLTVDASAVTAPGVYPLIAAGTWGGAMTATALAATATDDKFIPPTEAGLSASVEVSGSAIQLKVTRDIADAEFSINPTTFVYNGSEQGPAVTATWGDDTLTAGTDFTVEGGSATDVGTYNLHLVGTGDYAGTTTNQQWKITAAEYTWKGPEGGEWGEPANWTPPDGFENTIPDDANKTAVLPNGRAVIEVDGDWSVYEIIFGISDPVNPSLDGACWFDITTPNMSWGLIEFLAVRKSRRKGRNPLAVRHGLPCFAFEDEEVMKRRFMISRFASPLCALGAFAGKCDIIEGAERSLHALFRPRGPTGRFGAARCRGDVRIR